MNSIENIKRRFYVRAVLFSFNTFVTAAFPFMGDFVNLFGSFTLIPITFVFPSMIFLKVTNLFWTALILLMKNIKEAISKTKIYLLYPCWLLQVKGKTARLEKKVWHWSNIILFSLLAVVTTISAVRLIVNDVQQYSFFANT